MSFLDRSKEVATTVGQQARKQARRAQLEVELRRIQSRINHEYTAIGRSLYSSLAEGGPGSDVPEVQVALAEVKNLKAEMSEKRDAIERLKAEGNDTGPDEPAVLPAPPDGTAP